jgi:hypothetical protein
MPLALLLLLLAAPAEDLMPREGAGWSGFRAGSWVRIKQTRIQKGRMLAPTITRFTLKSADTKTLTLSIKAENALGIANDIEQSVPSSGDAGAGETEKVEGPGEEAVVIAGKQVPCDRVQATVTGPAGKRVITKWISREPKTLAKRVTVSYGVDGKEASRETLLLESLATEVRAVGERKLKCLRYATARQEAGFEFKGTAYVSRDVPTGLAWSEDEILQNGEVVLIQRAEALEFESK